ncbi:MAG: dienelactone hydrolase family protein [Nannocystaceae bacterium]
MSESTAPARPSTRTGTRRRRRRRGAALGLLAAHLVVALACERASGAPSPSAPPPITAPTPAPAPAPAPIAAPTPAPAPDEAVPRGYRHLAGIDYVERVTGGADPESALPMIVAIHGLGDRPENFGRIFAGLRTPARVILPAGLDPSGDGFSWFPVRARSRDVVGLARGLKTAADRLAPFVEALPAARPTQGKPVVTGFSQGGMLSFALAVDHPALVAAAFPVGGWLPPPLWPEDPPPAGAPPIVALHGEVDAVVALAPTRDAVDRLRELGWDARLETYGAVAHQISAPMRSDLFRLVTAALGAAPAPAGLPAKEK